MLHLRELGTSLLRFLYPPACAVCGAEPAWPDEPLCQTCLGSAEPHLVPGAPDMLFLGRHVGALRCSIRLLKSGEDLRPAAALGTVLGRLLRRTFPTGQALVSVPSSPEARRRRGFNPARVVATAAAAAAGLPLVDEELFVKVRETRKQAFLTGQERLANTADAYRAHDDLGGLRVILLDDVLTTGATLHACREALELAFAKIPGAAFLSRRPLFCRAPDSRSGKPLRARASEIVGL